MARSGARDKRGGTLDVKGTARKEEGPRQSPFK
jgi:hypothetical protein